MITFKNFLEVNEIFVTDLVTKIKEEITISDQYLPYFKIEAEKRAGLNVSIYQIFKRRLKIYKQYKRGLYRVIDRCSL